MIRCDVVRDVAALADVQSQWVQLFDSGIHEISTSYEWTQALLRTSLQADDIYVQLMFRSSNRLLGIIPLVVRRGARHGISIVHLFPLSELYNTHSDLLVAASNKEILEVFLRTVRSLGIEWDVFRMDRVIEGGPLLHALEELLTPSAFNCEIAPAPPSFYLRLTRSYDEFLQQRSGKFRSFLKRLDKKIRSRYSDIRVAYYQENRHVLEGYEHLLSIERRSWKHQKGTSIPSRENQMSFFRELCESSSARGWLHLSVLFLDGCPVAHNLGLLREGRYSYLKTSFDEGFREVSPSAYLRAQLIERLIHDGVAELDFPAEPYEWERQWTNATREHRTIRLYSQRFRAKVYSVVRRIKRLRLLRESRDSGHVTPLPDLSSSGSGASRIGGK